MTDLQSYDDFANEYVAKIEAAVAAMSPRWGVRGYKAHNTRDGVAYVFTLTDGPTTVAYVEDSGTGGAPFLDWIDRKGTTARDFDAESHLLFGEGYVQEEMIEAVLQRAGK